MYNANMVEFLSGRSYLYSGEITDDILRSNNVEVVDLLTIEMKDIGIKELRVIISQAAGRAFGKNRLLWLKNVESPTDIIQDTLLKILEEPPKALIVVVQARNAEELLPTLRSRLHAVHGVNEVVTDAESAIPQNKQQADVLLRGIKERTDLTNIFIRELSWTRQEFLKKPTPMLSSQLQQLSSAISRLKQNCNQKMVIDTFLLHWTDTSGKA